MPKIIVTTILHLECHANNDINNKMKFRINMDYFYGALSFFNTFIWLRREFLLQFYAPCINVKAVKGGEKYM